MAEHTVLGGRYELGEPLGRGGMAEVRRGQDLRLNRPVAVKLLSAELAADPVFRTRFRREAQSAASLNAPSIVAVFDTGEEEDPVTGVSVPYIVMELVEGQTLRSVLTGGHQLPPQQALEVTQGVLDALAHSHDAGIVHRDIKPANVMLTRSGAVKVMDFGIARAVTDTSTDLTQTSAVIGTAQYLSPEQARGEKVDSRTDIYSTGCLMYELLVGRPPFVGETALSLAYQHVREPPAPPSEHNPLIHPQIEAIVLKALAKDRDDRYQTARDMRADIARVLSGQQPAAVPVPLPVGDTPTVVSEPAVVPAPVVVPAPAEPTPPARGAVVPADLDAPRRRRPALLLLVATLVLLLIAGAGYGLYRTFGGGAMVSVPDVTGDTLTDAQRRLNDARLTVDVIEVAGKDDKTVDTVTRQTPVGGAEVRADSAVTIEINLGSDATQIPDGLIGEDVDKVTDELEDAGFTKVRAKEAEEEPADADKDDVLSIDPREGSMVTLDEVITVYYATGKSEKSASGRQTSESPEPTATQDSESAEPSEPASDDDETESESPTTAPTDTEKPTSPPTSADPGTPKPSKSKPSKTNSSGNSESSGKSRNSEGTGKSSNSEGSGKSGKSGKSNSSGKATSSGDGNDDNVPTRVAATTEPTPTPR